MLSKLYRRVILAFVAFKSFESLAYFVRSRTACNILKSHIHG